MSAGWGELAAFGTAASWALSSYVHGQVGRMVGVTGITLLRLPFQLGVLGLLCLATGSAAPLDAESLALLFLSGVCGLAVADYLLYKGMTVVGPQIALLLNALSAPCTALIGWLFLGEALPLSVLGGIVLCIFGISVVLGDRGGGGLYPGQTFPRGKHLALGIAGCALAALFLALSFVVWKKAMLNGTNPLWATFIRLSMAAITLWGAGLFRGWSAKALRDLRSRPDVFKMLLGTGTVSACGMWLAGIAMDKAPAGVAVTIIGLQPVLVTVLAALVNRRSPTAKSICGTVIAFAGTAVICLR